MNNLKYCLLHSDRLLVAYLREVEPATFRKELDKMNLEYYNENIRIENSQSKNPSLLDH